MSSYQALSISRRAAGVAQITMNRPAVFNAFDEAMIGEMDAAFAEVIADDSVRVIVLVGEGKHFSAGADLQWMQRASQALDKLAATLKSLVDKGRLDAEMAREAIGRTAAINSLAQARDSALVVEAIVEKLEAKRSLFNELEGIVAPGAVLATNTSSTSLPPTACSTL